MYSGSRTSHTHKRAFRATALITVGKLGVSCGMAVIVGLGRWYFGKVSLTWGDLGRDLGIVIGCYVFVVLVSYAWNFAKFWGQGEHESIIGEPGTAFYDASVMTGRIRDCITGFYKKYGPEPNRNLPQLHADWRIQFRPYFRASLEQPVRDLIIRLQAEGTEMMGRGTYALN